MCVCGGGGGGERESKTTTCIMHFTVSSFPCWISHLALMSWESLANFLQAELNSGILSNSLVT